MRGFAVALSILLASSPIGADSLTAVDGSLNNAVDFGPSITNLTQVSVMLWIRPTAYGTNAASTPNILYLYSNASDGTLGFLRGRATTAMNYVSNASQSGMESGRWKCFGVTFDFNAGATNAVKFYAGSSTSSMISLSGTAVAEGSGPLLTVGSDKCVAGGLGTAALGGDYGLMSVSSGVWTLRDFQEQQFTPHVTTGTLLLAYISAASSPTVRDVGGQFMNGTLKGLTYSADGAPTYLPVESW